MMSGLQMIETHDFIATLVHRLHRVVFRLVLVSGLRLLCKCHRYCCESDREDGGNRVISLSHDGPFVSKYAWRWPGVTVWWARSKPMLRVTRRVNLGCFAPIARPNPSVCFVIRPARPTCRLAGFRPSRGSPSPTRGLCGRGRPPRWRSLKPYLGPLEE